MKYRFSGGFTLIELAIVLVIVGVLIGSFIGTLTTRIENMRVAETRDGLEEIKIALIGYAYVNDHLPCPDCISPGCSVGGFRDGIEDRTAGGLCATNVASPVGSLPWVTLGLGRGDAWGTRYRYWVDNVYADDGTGGGSKFGLASGSGSGIIREPDYVADPTGATLTDLATNVVAVVFSHGKNSYDGYSANNVKQGTIPVANVDELENRNNDSIFVSRPPSTTAATTAGGEFDDIVDWISGFELKAKMVEAGRLP